MLDRTHLLVSVDETKCMTRPTMVTIVEPGNPAVLDRCVGLMNYLGMSVFAAWETCVRVVVMKMSGVAKVDRVDMRVSRG